MNAQESRGAKTSLKAYLTAKGIDTRKPFRCLSPAHEDIHPSMSYDEARDRVHCFSCGVTYDIIDVAAMDRGGDKAAALRDTISFYRAKLNDAELDGSEYWCSRGFTPDTIQRFRLRVENGRAVIPFSKDYELVRSINKKNYFNPKGRKIQLYDPENAKGLIIVVEGAIDAISVLQASNACEIGCAPAAIALNGVANVFKFAQSAREDSVYCLALDNDDAGYSASGRLSDLLDRRGISNMTVNLYGGYKDANERLIDDPGGLARALKDVWELYTQDAQNAHSVHDALCVQNAYDTHNAHEVCVSRRDESVHVAKKIKNSAERCENSSNLAYLDDVFDENPRFSYQNTGISSLDGLIIGLPSPGFTVIGAPAGAGKTTLCLQIADNIAKSGQDVLFFTCEMQRRELIKKSLARETLMACAKTAVKSNELDANKDGAALRAALDAYSSYAGRVFMYETPAAPSNINEIIGRHRLNTGRIPFVVIDYLQLLPPDAAERLSDKEILDRSVAAFRRMCMEYGASILAISSLNRASYGSSVDMPSFKESGSIEYTADLLLGMKADKNYGDITRVELSVIKNRYGMSGGRAELKFYAAYGCFV